MKINEIFLSIQGEGLNMGLPTVFVRTAGCNLRCSYCDTKYAYDNGENLSINDIAGKVSKFHTKRVCITGGEPLLQEDMLKLISRLRGYSISIETNGSLDISLLPQSVMVSLDIKCPSSGETGKMRFQNLKRLTKKDQAKFIIGTSKDYKFAKDIVTEYRLLEKTNVIFTPVGGIKAKPLVKNVLHDSIDARIGIQAHKAIWGVKRRGV